MATRKPPFVNAWADMDVIEDSLVPSPETTAAVFQRTFGTGPPRGQDRPSAKGYTKRELRIVLRRIKDHRSLSSD